DACVVVAELPLPFSDHDGDDTNSNGYVDATEGTTNLLATPVRFSGLIPVVCSDTDSLCVKDAQHTMWDTTTLTRVGSTWVADSTVALRGGDTDFDGDVDTTDLETLLDAWGTTTPNAATDFNHDGAINFTDLSTLLAHWSSTRAH
ncbi:MAG: hypothetical protein KDA21_02155, partial [Phycisphaerales bacterium]|nr:hypothetical protein [Phycisphaerales bacterium]